MSDAPALPVDWPGKALGLPRSGPRSVARFGRRFGAIVVDWAMSSILAYAFFGAEARFQIPLIFAALQVLSIAVFSGSIGHLVFGLRVVPLQPKWIGLLRPLIRSFLLILVIPAAIWDQDQRGLHDKAAGTVLVRH